MGLAGAEVLVVGGAGFVGSNLVHRLIAEEVGRVIIIDNLLSAERSNIPPDPRVELIEASIAEDQALGVLEDRFEHVFHLATFHGNQNSIAAPLADHANNTLTTLKLFERLSSFQRLRSVVYALSLIHI